MNVKSEETKNFILNRIAFASVGIYIVIANQSILDYSVSPHAYILGYVSFAHILCIPVYFFMKHHKVIIEYIVNSAGVLAGLYYTLGIYALKFS